MLIESKFFEHGFFRLDLEDERTGEGQFKICLPCSLFLSVVPVLLGQGLISGFELRNPVSVWSPKITKDRLVPHFQDIAFLDDRINRAVEETCKKSAEVFSNAASLLQFPDDLIASLPLGVYVELTYRCRIDNLGYVLMGMEENPHTAIGYFRYAVGDVLSQILTKNKQLVSG